MTAYNAGGNYYDTAYIYPGSEAALGKILEKNNIRDMVEENVKNASTSEVGEFTINEENLLKEVIYKRWRRR